MMNKFRELPSPAYHCSLESDIAWHNAHDYLKEIEKHAEAGDLMEMIHACRRLVETAVYLQQQFDQLFVIQQIMTQLIPPTRKDQA